MNETPKNIIQTGHFVAGKTPQPKIEIPSHDDVSGEKRSQNTSLVAGATCVGMENPNKTTSGKTAAPISLSTSTVQASDVNGGDSSFDDFIVVKRRGSGRSAKTGKKPLRPHNQVEGQLPQKNCGRIDSSLLLQEVAQSSLKQSISRQGSQWWWEYSPPPPPHPTN